MILNRLQLFGYKRLAEVDAYVGRKAVALVGPNEAGKTSVLSALVLTNDDNPVSKSSYSRTLRKMPRADNAEVVKLWFTLSEDHRAMLKDLPLRVRPDYYVYHKRADGKRVFSLEPYPRVDNSVRTSVVASAERLDAILGAYTSFVAEERTPEQEQLFRDLSDVMDDMKGGDAASDEAWDRLGSTINAASPSSEEDRGAVQSFETAFTWARSSANLQQEIRDRLALSAPRFALFSELHRNLLPRYSLDDGATDSSPALANLLQIAEITIDEIRDNREEPAYLKELLERATERLADFFATRWSQEKVSVSIDTDGPYLDIAVRDVGAKVSGGWLAFDERSDGLRTFVALAAFLARASASSPPILLIDEAEQHLHLNAQADLVQLLVGLPQIRQVIYTTHSPGCLPPDIGNGVRFVEPSPDGTSRIRHDFWDIRTTTHVGFNPLLMVMGAGAAAFSGLRYALFVEGASDMLLLPSMIRLAVDAQDLPYQVAPGISMASKSELRSLDFEAGRVLFLVDGDQQGRVWARDLLDAEVPASRIYALQEDLALEDLLDREFYLDTVAGFLDADSQELSAIAAVGPVKAAVSEWAKTRHLQMPGPVALAEHVLGANETGQTPIKLNAQGVAVLRELDSWARKQLHLGS